MLSIEHSFVSLQARTSAFYIVISVLTVLFVLFFYVFIYLYKRYISFAYPHLYDHKIFDFDLTVALVLQGNENSTTGTEASLTKWKKEKTFIDRTFGPFNNNNMLILFSTHFLEEERGQSLFF